MRLTRRGTIVLVDLSLLPYPAGLRRRHEPLVAVEALVAADPQSDPYYSARPPIYSFASGTGASYDLVLDGDDALLMAFDHESPRSPWARDDGAMEWPGMFDGLPDRLRRRLPEPEDDEPMSVTACLWFT